MKKDKLNQKQLEQEDDTMGYSVQVDEDGVYFIPYGKHKLRLDLEEVEDHFKEQAIRELRETPEIVKESLEKFRELLREETTLNVPIDDDKFLVKFLRPCKYYPYSALNLLKKFYGFKLENPKYAKNVTPFCVKKVFDTEVKVILPTRSKTGCRLLVLNAGKKWNTKLIKIDDIIRSMIVTIEIAMLEPKTQVAGVYVIINLEGLSFSHITQFSPSVAKKIVEWVQDCIPVRLKGIHIVNQPGIFNMLFALFKPFLGEKLRKRIHFHGTNFTDLVEVIGAESLPEYLGGVADIPDVPPTLFSELLTHYEDDFKLHNTYGFKES